MATVAAASLATLLLLLRLTRESTKPKPLRYTIPSPRETLLPFISAEEAAALSYPPNLLPGARDVATPYGTMRVYEWGPEDGRKVIMIHGDTSPVPILAPIGDALVKRGCRVMMFGMSSKARVRLWIAREKKPCGIVLCTSAEYSCSRQICGAEAIRTLH